MSVLGKRKHECCASCTDPNCKGPSSIPKPKFPIESAAFGDIFSSIEYFFLKPDLVLLHKPQSQKEDELVHFYTDLSNPENTPVLVRGPYIITKNSSPLAFNLAMWEKNTKEFRNQVLNDSLKSLLEGRPEGYHPLSNIEQHSLPEFKTANEQSHLPSVGFTITVDPKYMDQLEKYPQLYGIPVYFAARNIIDNFSYSETAPSRITVGNPVSQTISSPSKTHRVKRPTIRVIRKFPSEKKQALAYNLLLAIIFRHAAGIKKTDINDFYFDTETCQVFSMNEISGFVTSHTERILSCEPFISPLLLSKRSWRNFIVDNMNDELYANLRGQINSWIERLQFTDTWTFINFFLSCGLTRASAEHVHDVLIGRLRLCLKLNI